MSKKLEEMNPKELVSYTRDGYDIIANEWDITRKQAWVEMDSDLSKYFSDNMKVLDIGCGNGRALLTLKNYKNIEYLGIDPSVKLIQKAKENFPNYTFETFDGLDFSKYKKNYYDLLLCIAVIHHLPESLVDTWLQDIKNLLKPNGQIILTSWDVINGKSSNLLSEKSDGLLPFMHHKNIRYVKSYTKEEIEVMLKRNGYEILDSKYYDRESKERNIFITAKNL